MAAFRIEYEQAGLDERDLDPDPFVMFDRWFADAAGAGISEPNAMVVATVGRDGQPTARAILLKEVRDRRFVNQFMGRDYVTIREVEWNGVYNGN